MIAITCERWQDDQAEGVARAYVEAVLLAGGTPVLLPALPGTELQDHLSRFDGFLFTGGGDLDPRHFGADPSPALGTVSPERDRFELWLARQAHVARRPVLGICRGVQTLAVALGGRLYQDLASEVPGAIQHRQKGPRAWTSHRVTVVGGTRLAAGVGHEGELFVNSFHHQAVREPLPAGLVVSARAPDGVVEALEDPHHPYFLGVQWHPEHLVAADARQLALFQALVQQAEVVHGG